MNAEFNAVVQGPSTPLCYGREEGGELSESRLKVRGVNYAVVRDTERGKYAYLFESG